MKKITLILCLSAVHLLYCQNPDTVSILSGKLKLKGLFWHSSVAEKSPTVIFSHGSYETTDTLHNPVQDATVLGKLFVKRGYNFLAVFRRGTALSYGQGENGADLMKTAFQKKGQEERNKVQLQQLETVQLQDMIAALGYLRSRKDVDTNQIVLTGHSFGGSLALLLAEHDLLLKAVVVFGMAGYSWELSPRLRERLITAAENITTPVMMVCAQNDYSVKPGYALDSLMNQLNKPHLLKIYPKFGDTQNSGHNLVFLSTQTWEADVFKLLSEFIRL